MSGQFDVDDADNKRVVGSVGRCFLPEPYGSVFSGLYGLNPSDSAAHAKHYTPQKYKNRNSLIKKVLSELSEKIN
jgi:hypothetical protein